MSCGPSGASAEALRSNTYVHVAMHDALVLCARRGVDAMSRKAAVHVAASRVLAHLFPQEPPGRIEAMGVSAATAALLSARASGVTATEAPVIGREAASVAIRATWRR